MKQILSTLLIAVQESFNHKKLTFKRNLLYGLFTNFIKKIQWLWNITFHCVALISDENTDNDESSGASATQKSHNTSALC